MSTVAPRVREQATLLKQARWLAPLLLLALTFCKSAPSVTEVAEPASLAEPDFGESPQVTAVPARIRLPRSDIPEPLALTSPLELSAPGVPVSGTPAPPIEAVAEPNLVLPTPIARVVVVQPRGPTAIPGADKAIRVVSPLFVPVSDGELAAARILLVRAVEARAEFYDPATLGQAQAALAFTEASRFGDPTRSRQSLARFTALAGQAYDNSLRLAARRFEFGLDDQLRVLRAQAADRFLPERFLQLAGEGQRVLRLFADGRVSQAQTDGQTVLSEVRGFSSSLGRRLETVAELRQQTESYLDQADSLEAYIWAAEQSAELNSRYLAAVEAFQSYQLAEAEELFGAAVELGRDTVRLAALRSTTEQRTLAESLMIQVMRSLETASQLTVVTEDGTVIEPQPWSGSEFLPSNGGRLPEKEDPSPQSWIPIPHDGSVAILGQTVEDNLLRQAQEIWQRGVVAYQAGDMRQASLLFRDAQRYVEAFRAYAVKGVYTVQLIPNRRDCLWRIAEYDFVYDNPFLWPRIWRRNRALIQNPDLIYPGWQLIIPPE